MDPRPVVESARGEATVAGYTVLYEAGRRSRGVAIVDVGAGAVVQSDDAAMMARTQWNELRGTRKRLGDGRSFTI